jgi:hypothetical protein
MLQAVGIPMTVVFPVPVAILQEYLFNDPVGQIKNTMRQFDYAYKNHYHKQQKSPPSVF